jgi:ABC-type multidrug transport system ATPase subunit
VGGASPNADAAISVRGIRKRFGFRDVLRGIDFDVERGSCVAIFGPNGAGKSTLMRIVATQWSPSEGSGKVLGFDLVKDKLEIRRRLGVVMHQSFLRDELTLEENLSLTAALYGVDDGEVADELLERFGLYHRRRDPVGTFSQGMTKRANIIRSLLHAPELWILDEPFSGLDPEGQDLLSEMIGTFTAKGGTALIVTHRTALGEQVATRTVELVDGELTREAS